jgi:glutamate dehydrogenase/leucine dehydrogenase
MTGETSGRWDGEALLERFDAETGATILIALHSSRLGPSSGGTRMKAYPDLDAARRDAQRLSEGMTYKWAAAGFPRGGGKAVLAVPGDLEMVRRDGLLRRYGSFIRELSGRFWTGADVGTSPRDMDVIAETGAPYVFSRTPEHGGAGDSAGWTALGVEAGLRTTCARVFGEPSLAGRRILVQGAGSVGGALIERLLAARAEVAFSDVTPAAVRHWRDDRGVRYVPSETVLAEVCDVLAPCALGGVLDAASIPKLKCRAVAGAANNQLGEPEDGARLAERGILYAPDYVINAGGAIGITGQESLGWSEVRARREVLRIGDTLARVYDLAQTLGTTTEAAARRIAEEALARGPVSAPPGGAS